MYDIVLFRCKKKENKKCEGWGVGSEVPLWKKCHDTQVGVTDTAMTMTDTRECQTMLKLDMFWLYLSVWSGAELSAPSRANPLEQLRELDP